MLAAACFQLSQKQNLIVDFLDGNMVVFDSRKLRSHVVEFVIMGGKQHLGTVTRMFVQVLGNRPCDGNPVVSACATANFIQQYQTSVGDVVKDAGRLVHLDHKSGFASRDIVRCAYTSENLVYQSDMRLTGRYETAHLRHQHNQGGLPQQGRFSRHVGSGDDDNLLLVVVEVYVVVDIRFAGRQLCLDDRMPAGLDVQHGIFFNIRTRVAV